MKLELSMAEVGAIQAIARGATQLRMTSRIKARLLERGLISRPRHEFAVTAAGRRAANPRRFNDWPKKNSPSIFLGGTT